MEKEMVAEQNWDTQWGQLVAKVWADDKLKARLVENPESVLKEHSMSVPPGMQVKVVENTDRVIHLALPAKPSSEELASEDLLQVAGGIYGNDSCCLTYSPKAGQNKPPSRI